MSHFVCRNCQHEADIFGHGGGEQMAAELKIPFLGRIPIYQPIREGGDTGVPLLISEPDSPASQRVRRRGGAHGRTGVDRQLQPAHHSRSPSSGERTLPQQDRVNIPFTKHTLANGLDVLLHEDHSCPIVAVNIWYHVGSKNERPGHTGFAHLFEHLMFEGSEHHDSGFFQPLQAAGASLNGSTSADRTNYWEVVPTGALELALWMESDRMGYLLPALTQQKFSNQRDVVLNERRQNYENRPYGLASMAMLAALFPPEHPYHWSTIGEVADLQAAKLDEVHQFFRRYYHPANASIALARRHRSGSRAGAGARATSSRSTPARWSSPCARPHRSMATAASSWKIASSCRASISRG